MKLQNKPYFLGAEHASPLIFPIFVTKYFALLMLKIVNRDYRHKRIFISLSFVARQADIQL